MNTKMMMTMMMIDDKYDDGYHLTFLFQQRSRVLQHYEWPACKATCVNTTIRDKNNASQTWRLKRANEQDHNLMNTISIFVVLTSGN